MASSSRTKSKNKASKKRRDALKKRLVEFGGAIIKTNANSVGTDDAQDEGPCKKFILVDEY